MDIETAFTVDAIDIAGTNVGDDDENELREIIRKIYESNQFDVPNEPAENIAVLCFVAGRTYQHDAEEFQIPIPISLVVPFMEFLAQRLKGAS
jgi:hypothetical protein